MNKASWRSWRIAVPLLVVAVGLTVAASASFASSKAGVIRVAIMTDCKGAFSFGYDYDSGGAQAAFAQYAHGKVKNKNKPSAGMTGINVAGKQIKIVGYGCGNDTVPTAVTETKRLMEQLKADVMVGPLSGDEAVYVANYAKAHPTKTFIVGTAGSQDPTLQIAPKNLFRYHGDGAMWNAGAGEIAYKKLGWRKAAIMKKYYPKQPADDGFVYNYYNAAWALVQGLQKSGGQLGSKLQAAMPRTLKAAFQVSNGGVLHLDANRQGIQDQYPLQLVKQADGSIAAPVIGFVPNVDQGFHGLFKKTSPPPGRTQPACKRAKLPWQ